MIKLHTDIADYLRDYYPKESGAIKGRELCALFNLKDKQLRNIVTVLRQEGEAICSSSYGYWYSRDPEDLEKTLHRLEAQVRNMNYSIAGLQRILQEVQNEPEEI